MDALVREFASFNFARMRASALLIWAVFSLAF
jgi:hypothetical protein